MDEHLPPSDTLVPPVPPDVPVPVDPAGERWRRMKDDAVKAVEESITHAETQGRRVLTPKEWAAQLGATGRGDLLVAR
jgi:hypothetical protein